MCQMDGCGDSSMCQMDGLFIYLKLYSTSPILQFTKARPINKINSSIKH